MYRNKTVYPICRCSLCCAIITEAAMSVLQRQLTNAERARRAEEQMMREVTEVRYSRHRHSTPATSSPTPRLAPLRSHQTPRRKDVKFAPDTKTHDGGQRINSANKHTPLSKAACECSVSKVRGGGRVK